jgi:putative transcriptional regulator
MEKTIFSQLETTALFAGLTANAIERQLEKLPYSIRKVPAKTVFLSANEPLREMVMVLEGRVSAKMTTPKGKCLMVDLLKPGTILAPAFVFSDDNRMPVEVEAVEESVFFSMSKSHFSMLIGRNEQVRANFLGILSHINFFLMTRYECCIRPPSKRKLPLFCFEGCGVCIAVRSCFICQESNLPMCLPFRRVL